MTERPSSRRRLFEERLGLNQPVVDTNRIFLVPDAITYLVGAMVFVFLLQWFLPGGLSARLTTGLGFIPLRFTYGLQEGQGLFGVILPLFTHMFVHSGFMHIAFNMIWLVVFGTGVARRLGADGPPGPDRLYNTLLFAAFFSLCGVVGALSCYFLYPNLPINLVGASGAISGLMAGAFRFALRPYAPYGVQGGALAPIISRPVLVVSALFIGVNLLTALGLGSDGGAVDIAWEGHIGGYLCGLFTFPLFDRLVRRPEPPLQL